MKSSTSSIDFVYLNVAGSIRLKKVKHLTFGLESLIYFWFSLSNKFHLSSMAHYVELSRDIETRDWPGFVSARAPLDALSSRSISDTAFVLIGPMLYCFQRALVHLYIILLPKTEHKLVCYFLKNTSNKPIYHCMVVFHNPLWLTPLIISYIKDFEGRKMNKLSSPWM